MTAYSGNDVVANLVLKARDAHEQGEHALAMQLYQQVLQHDPHQIEALNVTGMLLAQQGALMEGLERINIAIARDNGEARSYFHRGIIQEHMKQYAQALESYTESLRRDSSFAPAFHNAGLILSLMGRNNEAVAHYQQAVRLNPAYADAYFNCANLLQQMQQYEYAIAYYERAIHINPSQAAYHNNLGVLYKTLSRFEEARQHFQQAVTLFPHYAHAYNNLGATLNDLGRPEEALAFCERAIELDVNYADPNNNRGVALERLGRDEEALASFNVALALNPQHIEAYSNKAEVLRKLCRYEEALANYDKALAFNAAMAEVNFNKGVVLMLLGRFSEGWKLLEWRYRRRDVTPVSLSSPLWSGIESLADKTLLIHAEQGLGDAIMFCRYLPKVQAIARRVVLRVHASLIPLLATMKCKPELIAMHEEVPHDYHCMLMSLPGIFNTQLHDIPVDVPYLFADERKLEQWGGRLGHSSALRVGVAWAGSPSHRNDRNRSVALAQFATLFASADAVEFHALQKDISTDDLVLLKSSGAHVHHQSITDFADTAALIMHMDVVITVDTSIAHLAGALGKKVWILVPFAPDFRWLAVREDSPWYPTARLFRQPRPADWAAVLDTVKRKLQQERHDH